jgi:hypothetical protein
MYRVKNSPSPPPMPRTGRPSSQSRTGGTSYPVAPHGQPMYPPSHQEPTGWHDTQYQHSPPPPSHQDPYGRRRSPSPQEHAAYNARTGSVGYGRGPRTPSPVQAPAVRPWGPSARIQNLCQEILDLNQDSNAPVRLTQYTDQASCPGTNGGICNAMTGAWIRLGAQSQSMAEASAAFGHALDTNVDAMKQSQQAFEARIGDLRSRQREVANESIELRQEWKELEPYIKKAHRMTPASRKQLEAEVEDLEQRMTSNLSDLNEVSTEIQRVSEQEMRRLGGGLACKKVVEDHPFSDENLAHDLNKYIQEPGYYALHVSLPDGPGHVMGVHVGRDGRFRFMDPNTGEFAMSHRSDMLNVVATNVAGCYSKSTSFSLQHFAA